MNRPSVIADSLPFRTRFLLLGATLFVALFTFIYARLVCTYICSLEFGELARNIIGLTLVQASLRALLLSTARMGQPGDTRSPARKAYLLSVASWFITGLLAIGLHALLYWHFPTGSHFKFAIGYWVLGGGIIAQIEYLWFERALPSASLSPAEKLRERLGQRLVEGYFIFTTAPALVLLLTLLRVITELGGASRQVVESALLAAFFVGAALVAAFAYGNSLHRDSDRLLHAVRRVGQGDFQPGASTSRPDELSLVAAGINEMANGLQLRERIRDAFGRFVSKEVASEFIETYLRPGKTAELGGKRRDVVVLFSDLRDFTPLSESLEPEQLIDVLNGYFAEMVGAIQENGGRVDKFIGDAVLAVFGLTGGTTEEEKKEAALSAVLAAKSMQERLEKYNETLRERGIKLQSGVGIHAGEVVAGYLGSAERLEFTVIGHTVNVAARIEGQAKAPLPRVLMSEEVARRVGEGVRVVEVKTVALKGVAQEVKLYGLEDEVREVPGTSSERVMPA